tara:strand:- start:2113 stop:3348 length:1236 start_codon:yes stop_codon:yes gene_type:complete
MEQVLYSLPDGWEWKTLSDVVDKTENLNPLKHADQLWTYIDISSVNSNRFTITDPKEVLGKDAPSRAKKHVQINDVIFATTRPNLKNIALVRDEYRSPVASSGFCVLRANENILPAFLFYFVTTDFVQAQIEPYVSGASYPAITDRNLKKASIPIPCIEEQKRIVEKLEALLTRIDTAIDHLQESVTLADALYASELNEVFPSDADIESLSDRYGWVYLSDICTFENGDRGKNYPSKSAFVAEGIPVVSAGNLGERYIDHKGLNYITPERYDLLRSGRIKIGDILFCLRGSLGKVAISKDIDDGVIASSLVIVRPKDRVSAEYVYRYFKSSLCQKFISYYNNGAAQPNLSAKSLGKFMLPLPNSEEQKKIVNDLDEKYQLNQKLLDALRIKINRLERLKASILDSAFKGDL